MEKVLGLEIHAQIATKTKLFSRSLNQEDCLANEQVDWLDAGMPGSLPVVNKEAIMMALKTSLALDMQINDVSIFDRKHYFYQDLPLGYQITQFYKPIGINGVLHCSFGKIRINRLHIECDAGKSIYENGATYIDLNRAGVPLMEIVTEPDFRNEHEVIEFLKELRAILLTIGTCRCDMEMGNFRVDVNLSVRYAGAPLGNRVEIKNLNSFKAIAKAVEYEYQQQVKTIKSGGAVIQETKLFDSKELITKSMRDKEDCADYRYFQDPDLLPVKLSLHTIENVRANLPLLPQAMRAEYIKLGIAEEQTFTLTEHPMRVQFFNQLIAKINSQFIVKASNWVTSELIGKLVRADVDFEKFLEERQDFASEFATIIIYCEENKITRVNAKEVLDALIQDKICAQDFIKQKGYLERIDNDQISKILENLIAQSHDEVRKYKNGKTAIVMFFVGVVMKETKGKCDAEFVKQECVRLLDLM